jgi:hypothetical protein
MGPKLGLNVVSPKFNNDVGISLPLKADANVGVFFSKDFKNGDKIQIELNYYTKVDVEFDSAGTQIAVMNDVGFIAIPLQYGFKFGKSNIYGLMGVSFLFSRAWTNFDDGDLDPVYNLMAPSGGSTSSSSNAMGVGAKLGLEYYYNKLSIMIYYEYPFITDNLYVVNESKLSFSHFGLSLYYNIVK